METWRIIATALFGAACVALALIVMAQVRESSDSAGRTAIAGAMILAASVIVGVLMITVLTAGLTWSLVAAAGIAVTVMVLAS